MATAVGLILFFGPHLLGLTPWGQSAVRRLGRFYKGSYALLSLAGLVFLVIGFRQSEFYPLWEPVSFHRGLIFAVMPVASVLLVASHIDCNIKRIVRHPMLIGVALWGLAHLLANGDLASTIIFASFAIYAILYIFLKRKTSVTKSKTKITKDIMAVFIGIVLYIVLHYTHEYYTGVPIST